MNTRLPLYSRIRTALIALAILAVLIGLPSCATTSAPGTGSEETLKEPASSEESTGIPAEPDEVPRISKEDLLQMVESGEIILIIDTRSKADYDLGHIQGAVSAPLAKIGTREWQPPPDKELILYCS
jgi:hypothetical protein